MQRLSTSALGSLKPGIRLPQYDRNHLAPGLAHIGVGAFHRCHQAEFTDDLLEKQFGAWGITGITMRPPYLAETLAPQDCLYSRTLRQGVQSETRIIGSIRRVIDAGSPEGCEAAIAALAESALKAVTLTITEKGYCHIPATGELDWANPELVHDRDAADHPITILGLLSRAMARRSASGAPGLTIISCDNLPANGVLLKRTFMAFLSSQPPHIAQWVEANVTFPSTMVDRIVPATTATDIDAASQAIGMADMAAVVGEPFRQWVIEDHFATDRPPWNLAGAQFVSDVTPYELIKMRVLNAAQSTLSHLGALLGHDFSFQAAADDLLAGLVRRMLERETTSTLPILPDMPIAPYIATSMTRIANPAIRHRCHQIGTDGSQKIVQRLINPMRERLAAGRPAELLSLAVAAWMAYVLSGAKRFGARWKPDDPWAQRVMAIGEASDGDFSALSRNLLGLSGIFGGDLVQAPVASSIATHLQALLAQEPRRYLARILRD